jgi:hypothetical protein
MTIYPSPYPYPYPYPEWHREWDTLGNSQVGREVYSEADSLFRFLSRGISLRSLLQNDKLLT